MSKVQPAMAAILVVGIFICSFILSPCDCNSNHFFEQESPHQITWDEQGISESHAHDDHLALPYKITSPVLMSLSSRVGGNYLFSLSCPPDPFLPPPKS
jgi:hypothetical protein